MQVKSIDSNNRQSFGIHGIITTEEFQIKALKSGLHEQIGETFKRIKQEFAQPIYDKLDLYIGEEDVGAKELIVVDKDLTLYRPLGTNPPSEYTAFTPEDIYKSTKALISNIFNLKSLDEHVKALNQKYNINMINSICDSQINLPQYSAEKFKPYFSVAAEMLSDLGLQDKFYFCIDGYDDFAKVTLRNDKLLDMKTKGNENYSKYAYDVPIKNVLKLNKFISEEEYREWLQKSIKMLEKSEYKVEHTLPEREKAREARRQKRIDSVKAFGQAVKAFNQAIFAPVINKKQAKKLAEAEEKLRLQACAADYFEGLKPEIEEKGKKAALKIEQHGTRVIKAGIPEKEVGSFLVDIQTEDVPEVVSAISTSTAEKIDNAADKAKLLG